MDAGNSRWIIYLHGDKMVGVNRSWLIGPLVFMFILAFLNLLGGNSILYYISVTNYIPNASGFSLSMMGISGLIVGMMVLVITVVSIGAAAGLNALGSGLNTSGTMILVKGTLWIGIWALLSGASVDALISSWVGTMVWFIVSFVYAIGASQEIFTLGGGAA